MKERREIYKGNKLIRAIALTILFFHACFVTPNQQESLIEETQAVEECATIGQTQEAERTPVVAALLEEVVIVGSITF